MTDTPDATDPRAVELVLALVSVAGSTAACRSLGDLRIVRVLDEYYRLAEETAGMAEGRVVKVMGDGVLLTFPISRARDVLRALEVLQHLGTMHWQQHDESCRVQVRIGAGSLVAGAMGPPGDRRHDVYGDVLNRLFRMELGTDIVMSAEARALLS
jgi:class 3 adenylate cyclase